MQSAVLGTYSDLELHCADGIVVKANAFTMITACEVLKHMYEDLGSLKTIPLPGFDASIATVTVNVIHGLTSFADMSLEDVEKCCTGFEYLGCTVLGKKLLARIWYFVSKTDDPLVLFKFADRLLASETHARDVLNKLKTLCPSWKDFAKVFDHVTMNIDTAVLCQWRLSRYFPSHLVFGRLLDAFPESVLTFDMCTTIMGCYRTGMYYHPDELVIISNKILSKFKDEPKATYLQAISDAFCMYEVSPSVSKLMATTLTFSNEPKTSVLIKAYDPFRGTRSLKVKRFMTASINTMDGVIGGVCDIEKLDETRHYPSTLLVRIICYNTATPNQRDTIDSAYAVAEVWREFRSLDHGEIVQLEHPTVRDHANEHLVSKAIASIDTLRYIRIDFFYGHGDIRKLPIF